MEKISNFELKASFSKNVEVEAVILLFTMDFLSFWPLFRVETFPVDISFDFFRKL